MSSILSSDDGGDVSALLFDFLFREKRVVGSKEDKKVFDALFCDVAVGFFAAAHDDFDLELLSFF